MNQTERIHRVLDAIAFKRAKAITTFSMEERVSLNKSASADLSELVTAYGADRVSAIQNSRRENLY